MQKEREDKLERQVQQLKLNEEKMAEQMRLRNAQMKTMMEQMARIQAAQASRSTPMPFFAKPPEGRGAGGRQLNTGRRPPYGRRPA